MKTSPLVLMVPLLMVAAGTARGQSSERHFLGLWEGVDINDGSKRTISITDRDSDGTFQVASRDTFWTLCHGDRGLELADGRVRPDGVLETTGLVSCFDGAPGIQVVQTYQFSRRDDTLLATPHGTTLQPITLHRVSER